LFPLGHHVSAQEADSSAPTPTLEEQLLSLINTVAEKEKSIAELKEKLKELPDETSVQQLNQQITTDEEIIDGMREQFIMLSAGGEKLFSERKVVEKTINWQEDLEAIFAPLIEQLKEISERPKLIEQLEQDISFWKQRSEELNRAVNYIKTTQNTVSNKKVTAKVKDLLSVAENQYETAGQKLSLLQSELTIIQSDDNPFWENITILIKSFATSMLYYLLLAIFFGVVIFQVVVLLSRIPRMMVNKKQPKRYIFATRVINLVKNVLGFVLAVIAYLIVLYSSGQWVLLVVSLFLLMAVALTLKDLLPKYFIEIRTLLNLGSIRQGERIIYNGLIWKINLIDIHTHLHNPALDGHLRVPVASLVDYSSRPFHKDEPWFPTKSGDTVLLEDGTFGQIQHQSVDVVEINLGSSVYTFPTSQFLERRPRNLSKGFTIYEIFGFDYQHQADSTTTMLSTYSDWVEKTIKQDTVGEYLTFFKVEFDKAAASSLDFKVFAVFSGDAASQYFRISRIIQKASVEAANHYDWVIPFQQLTIHRST